MLFSKIGFQDTLTDGDKMQSGTDPVHGTHLCQVLRVNVYVPDFYYFEVRARLWCNAALIGSYPRLGTVCWPISLKFKSSTAWPLKMGQIGCPETSVTRCKSTLCTIPEERNLGYTVMKACYFLLCCSNDGRILVVYTAFCACIIELSPYHLCKVRL
jgi:hypothetical protein